MFDGRELQIDVWRGEPPPGRPVRGPAVWARAEATLLVAPGWAGDVDEHGTIGLRDEEAGA